MREPGKWSLILLLLALAVAPLRHGLVSFCISTQQSFGKRVADWNWLIRLRRPIGLASFFYAVAHGAIYAYFDLDMNPGEFIEDLRNKPYIALGTVAFIILVPLAITSTDGWMRRLKRKWKRLHLLVYPAALLAEGHFVLLSKPGVIDPYLYGIVLFLLVGYRAIQAWQRGFVLQDRVDGTLPERGQRHEKQPVSAA